jgi:hypothetical protein
MISDLTFGSSSHSRFIPDDSNADVRCLPGFDSFIENVFRMSAYACDIYPVPDICAFGGAEKEPVGAQVCRSHRYRLLLSM